jgi:hypothetical protein
MVDVVAEYRLPTLAEKVGTVASGAHGGGRPGSCPQEMGAAEESERWLGWEEDVHRTRIHMRSRMLLVAVDTPRELAQKATSRIERRRSWRSRGEGVTWDHGSS